MSVRKASIELLDINAKMAFGHAVYQLISIYEQDIRPLSRLEMAKLLIFVGECLIDQVDEELDEVEEGEY